jgi:hypothetical protein
MVVVPADAVVVVPCLAEHLEDLADPASLADPVAPKITKSLPALGANRVLGSSQGSLPISARISLLSAGCTEHQRRLPD